jgi:FkbM family methyltransferase
VSIYKLHRFWIYRNEIIANIKSFRVLEGGTFQFLTDCFQKKIRKNYKVKTLHGIYGVEAFGDFDQVYTLNPFVEFQLQKYLLSRQSECFVDVGAFVGTHSIAYASCFNKSIVLSIEPAKANFRALEENIALNSLNNIITMNLAAAEKRETQFFGDGISSKHTHGVNEVGATSDALPLDEIILKHQPNCKSILLKIDVEGSEVHVIKGLIGTLNRVPAVALVVEILNEQNFQLVSSMVKGSGLEFIQTVSGSNYVFEKERFGLG